MTPTAYINVEKRSLEFAHDYMKWETSTTIKLERIPLYTTPPQRPWVGLTDAEAESAIDEVEGFAFGLNDGNVSNEYVIRYARIIEAKLKEKNA